MPFRLSVPGGSLPCAGTTVVGVAPTHRRRGVLRAMMRAHLDDAHERGEPLAALWASEEGIYGRFGYGRAVVRGRDRGAARARRVRRRRSSRAGSVRLVEPDEALEAFPPLWEAVARARPGMIVRSREWWEDRTLSDPADRRYGGGPEALRAARAGRRSRPATRSTGTDFGCEGGSSTSEARRRRGDRAPSPTRWRRCGATCSTSTGRRRSPRRSSRPTIRSSSCSRSRAGCGTGWATACGCAWSTSARRSRRGRTPDDGELVLDVRDELCPWNAGRWRLAGGAAEPTEAAADLALDVSALGAAYLGGVSLSRRSPRAAASRSSGRARSSEPTASSATACTRGARRSSEPPGGWLDCPRPGAVSSVGRAPARQAGGHWFEPSTAHRRKAPQTRAFWLGNRCGPPDQPGWSTCWSTSGRTPSPRAVSFVTISRLACASRRGWT